MSAEPPESKALTFLQSKYAVPTGIALALVVSVFLLTAERDGTLCMATLLIAIAGYIIPKNFGLKDLKWMLMWGVAFTVIMSTVAFTFTLAYYDENPDSVASIDGGPLLQGTVTPTDISEDGNYTFQVTVIGPLDNVTVHIGEIKTVYLEAWMGDEVKTQSLSNTTNENEGGYIHSAVVELKEGKNYFFFFTADDNGEEFETSIAIGPLTLEGSDALLFYWSQNFNQIFVLVGMPFFFLAFISWWMRRNIDRAVEKMEEQGRIPPRDGRPCVKCGAPLSKDAETCPGCGRVIPQYVPPQMPSRDPPAEKEDTFVCSECGAEVPEDAEACPGCGEEFED